MEQLINYLSLYEKGDEQWKKFLELFEIPIPPVPVDYFDILVNKIGECDTSLNTGSYEGGKEYTLTIVPHVGYELDHVKVNGVEVEVPYTFTLLENLKIDIYLNNFNKYSFHKYGAEGCMITGSNNGEYYEQEELEVHISYLLDHYTFSGWYDQDGNLLSIDKDYTFTINRKLIIHPKIDFIKEIDDDTVYDWIAFVKDVEAINGPAKSIVRAPGFEVGEDLIAGENSKLTVFPLIEDDQTIKTIKAGDVICLANPSAENRYYGNILSIEPVTNVIDEEKKEIYYEITTSQMQEFYKGNWIYDIVVPTNDDPDYNLEQAFANSLALFASGKIKNSTWTDTLFAKEKNCFKIKVTSNTLGKYESQEENTIMNMSDFIYTLFEKHGIILKFNIPYEPWEIGDENGGSVEIFKPSYGKFKIADNVEAIQDLAPNTKVEEVNKLVIFNSSDGSYRATYVYTTSGVVKEPTTDSGRLANVNTEIVFSDDPDDVLIKANIPEEMFNHEITFNLLLDNKIYKYDDFKLGMPVEVYANGTMYESILTGYKITKNQNEKVLYATFTCGKIRTSLTKKLFKKFGVV